MTLVIGLDGVTFDLLNPLMEEGVLPNLTNIIKNGSAGILKSTMPFYTGPAWVSAFTGVGPDVHGIFNFTNYDRKLLSRRILNATDIQCPKIWDIIAHYGQKAGMINIPMTYPASEVSGFMVTGMLSPGKNERTSFPSGLIEEIDTHVNGYIFNVSINLEKHKNDIKIIDKINLCLEKRAKAIEFLLSKYELDFFMAVFVISDRLQHLFWKYLDKNTLMNKDEKGRSFRKKAVECYNNLDTIIGKILTSFKNQEINVFLLSDHGFGNYNKSFYLNNWLIKEGFLKLKSNRSILTNLVRKMNVDWLKGFFPVSFRNQAKQKLTNNIIDYDKTTAYAAHSLEQGIYICELDEKEYFKLRDLLIDKLYNLRDPETGNKIVSEIFKRDELYGNTKEAPDLLINTADGGYEIRDTITNDNFLVSKENEPFGTHRRKGIFIAYGKNIKKGYTMECANIMDVTPTVLYSMGLPIPDYITGQVLENIFTEGFRTYHPIKKIVVDLSSLRNNKKFDYTDEESKSIKEQLKGLGYL